MSPELVVGLVAVFVSGGAIGSAGTLLAQWIVRKVDGEGGPARPLEPSELDLLRLDVLELGRHILNLDARLDFTEKLLDGALPLSPPPDRMHESPDPAETEPGEP